MRVSYCLLLLLLVAFAAGEDLVEIAKTAIEGVSYIGMVSNEVFGCV